MSNPSAYWSGDPKMEVFVIKDTDRLPKLDVFLVYAPTQGDETPVPKDVSTATSIRLIVTPCVGGRRLIDGIAAVGGSGLMTAALTPGVTGLSPLPNVGTDGHCQYAWLANELVAGEYLMEIIVDYGLATQETFPKGRYFKLVVVPHL